SESCSGGPVSAPILISSTAKAISSRSPHCGQSAMPASCEPKAHSRKRNNRASRWPMLNRASDSGETVGQAAASNANARSAGDWPCPDSHTASSCCAVNARIDDQPGSHGRNSEGRLGRLGHFLIALPTFVFELDVLDGDGVGVGVKIRQRLILG